MGLRLLFISCSTLLIFICLFKNIVLTHTYTRTHAHIHTITNTHKHTHARAPSSSARLPVSFPVSGSLVFLSFSPLAPFCATNRRNVRRCCAAVPPPRLQRRGDGRRSQRPLPKGERTGCARISFAHADNAGQTQDWGAWLGAARLVCAGGPTTKERAVREREREKGQKSASGDNATQPALVLDSLGKPSRSCFPAPPIHPSSMSKSRNTESRAMHTRDATSGPTLLLSTGPYPHTHANTHTHTHTSRCLIRTSARVDIKS